MSRGIESGTTTQSLQEFLCQTAGKVGATIRTNDSWNRKSCENLQQSLADSLSIQRSKGISHRPTRKFVHQNQSIIVLGFRFIRFSSHYHRANTIHIEMVKTEFIRPRNRSNRDSICNFNWSSKLTDLTRCTVLANSLIHSRKPKV